MTQIQQLSDASVERARARGVTTPTYDRSILKPGLVHIGVGSFHRCHQAEYTEDLLAAGIEDRYVTGINLRAPVLADTLGKQNGLYSQTLVDGVTRNIRVMGCMRKTLDYAKHARSVIDLLALPETKCVTMTVTEKAYCHVPATGTLDTDNSDVIADVGHIKTARSLPGVLALALQQRMQSGAGDITLISCDNVPSNGKVLRQVVSEMASQTAPELVSWLEDNVFFPSTMVDRIVPRPTVTDSEFARHSLGLLDTAVVVGEPFKQWVIANEFGEGMPAWEQAGAEIVSSVDAHEMIKMRILNGAQTTIAHIGCLLGIATTCAGVHDEDLRALVLKMLHQEVAATVPLVPGMDARNYIATSMARLENKALMHTNHQIATDGSQKIVQRLLDPVRDRLAAAQPCDLLIAASASWAAYLSLSSKKFGNSWDASDPLCSTVVELAERSDSLLDLCREILLLENVFGTELPANPVFRRAFERSFLAWMSDDPRAYVARLVAR
jgi:fructuronate reductase